MRRSKDSRVESPNLAEVMGAHVINERSEWSGVEDLDLQARYRW